MSLDGQNFWIYFLTEKWPHIRVRISSCKWILLRYSIPQKRSGIILQKFLLNRFLKISTKKCNFSTCWDWNKMSYMLIVTETFWILNFVNHVGPLFRWNFWPSHFYISNYYLSKIQKNMKNWIFAKKQQKICD